MEDIFRSVTGKGQQALQEGLIRLSPEDKNPGRSDDGLARVLLIEQDESNAELIQAVLAEEGGYEVRWVSTPGEAFDGLSLGARDGAFAEWTPCLILLDISGMNKEQRRFLSRTVQTHRRWPPTVMITELPSDEIHRVLQRAGKSDVVIKPFDLDTLLDSIRRVLSKR
jgi:DNA-binding response OmpR family regulator